MTCRVYGLEFRVSSSEFRVLGLAYGKGHPVMAQDLPAHHHSRKCHQHVIIGQGGLGFRV